MNRYEEPMMEVIGFDMNDAICTESTSGTWQGRLPIGSNSNDDSDS